MMERTYQNAKFLLRGLPRKERPFFGCSSVKRKPYWNGLGGMKQNLQLLGYPETELNRLKVIHVAGTKGKGSTCAFIDSFLRAHGKRTGFPQKVGLYTSPPISSIRETIRLNFTPIPEVIFTSYFFDVWEKVSRHALQNSYRLPARLQFLTLLSVHAFIQQRVDVAVYETHSGGEYDATNIFESTVTGITTLGMDHVEALGPTIEDIAWHKGGILRPDILAFSSPQTPAAAVALQQRALEKGAKLKFVNIDPILPAKSLALEPDVQKVNASLALAITSAFLSQEDRQLTLDDISCGIKQYSWPGRFHHIVNGKYEWFLDIAHNELSLEEAAKWFAQTAVSNQSDNASLERILIFSHFSDRDGAALLRCLWKSLHESDMQIEHVIFSTLETGPEGSANDEFSYKRKGSIDILQEYAEIWRNMDPYAQISLQPNIHDALQWAKTIGDRSNGMQTFVTGTTRLVGSALALVGQSVSQA